MASVGALNCVVKSFAGDKFFDYLSFEDGYLPCSGPGKEINAYYHHDLTDCKIACNLDFRCNGFTFHEQFSTCSLKEHECDPTSCEDTADAHLKWYYMGCHA